MAKPTAVDLFSGCGGMTLGLKQAGFSVRGAVEIDELCVRTYKLNHRAVRLWQSDIRDVSAHVVKRELGIKKRELTLLAACPPCEGFSTLRTKNGRRRPKDEKNDLVLEVIRFVEVFMPLAVMIENVPRLQRDRRMQKVRARLRDLGYSLNSAVLCASAYGVPQRRHRMILLASRVGRIEFGSVRDKRTVRQAIGALQSPGESGDPLHDVIEKRTPRVKRMIAAIPKDGGSRKDLPRDLTLECHKRSDGFKDVYGRMSWDDVAPTITGGCVNPSKGRFLHPEENRAISLREAALLQSFPPAYRFPSAAGKFPLAGLIGDALPPDFVEVHARAVLQHLAATVN